MFNSSKDLTLHKFGPYNPNPTDPDYKPPATINYLLSSEQKDILNHTFFRRLAIVSH